MMKRDVATGIILAAWVLWNQTTVDILKDGSWRRAVRHPWEPEAGFESLLECQTEAEKRKINVLKGLADVKHLAPYLPSEIDRLAFNPETSRWDVDYRCLPDNVDPRPRERR